MRKGHLRALCLLLPLCLALCGCAAQNNEAAAPPALEVPLEDIPTTVAQGQSTCLTTCYYKDAAGYLVPVQRTLPWTEGIAKATLERMVQSEENDYEAAALGLENVLPAGTTVDLDITGDRLARVSLSNEANSCSTAADEANMVAAVVCALTEFDTVKSVQLLINGHVLSTLKHGASVGQPLSRGDLNLESVSSDTALTGAKKVSLYFESAQSGAMVPVTRMVFSNADVETAVVELLRGPRQDAGLLSTLPPDAALLSVTRKDGVLTINFTEEFAKIAEETDGGRNAIKSLMLTCAQFDGVKQVKLQVNGKEWSPDKATLSIPTFINSDTEDVFHYLNE